MKKSDIDSHIIRAIENAGYRIDRETPPYRTFGSRGLFLVQKGFDRAGNAVVFKIAAPVTKAIAAIRKEAAVLTALERAVADAAAKGKKISIAFPKKVGEIHEDDVHGLVTSFVADDSKVHEALSPQDKIRIFLEVVRDLQQLEVPPELLRANGPIPVVDGKMHLERAMFVIEKLREQNQINAQEALAVLDMFEYGRKMLDALPPRFTHGDIHGGNIAYSKDGSGEKITLIDFELFRIDNEFRDLAILANMAMMGAEVSRQRELAPHFFDQLRRQWIDEYLSPLEKPIEEMIAHHPREHSVENAYRLMRIKHCLEIMFGSLGERHKSAELKRVVFAKILLAQLA